MREVIHPAIAALIVVAAAAGPTRADDESGLLTDRPDFTETTRAVGRDALQVEGGLTVADFGEASAYNLPELLVRAGVTRWLEARIGLPDYERIDEGGVTDHRIGEGSFGAKVQLGPDAAAWGLALIPAITVPLDRYEKARPAPELALAWSRDLPRGWSIGGIVSHAWLRVAERGANTLFPTVSLAAPAGERGGVFLEWAAELADGVDPAHVLHHGYTYAVAFDLQIDVHGGIGSGPAPDLFFGAGFAWRPSPRP